MKQKLYALDAFFIEKLKLSENDPYLLSPAVIVNVSQTYRPRLKRPKSSLYLSTGNQIKWYVIEALPFISPDYIHKGATTSR